MGKIKQGYLGAMTGKLGNAVGRMWKGRNVLAVMPASVANPRTTKQQIVRVRFTKIMNIVGELYQGIVIGMRVFARQMAITQGNVFVRKNWGCVTASSPDSLTITYSEISVAEGSLTNVQWGNSDWGSGTHLTCAFRTTDTGVAAGGNPNDEIYVMIYNPELRQSILSAPALRTTQSITVAVPEAWSGMNVHAWGFLVGETKNSDSTYLGHGEIE